MADDEIQKEPTYPESGLPQDGSRFRRPDWNSITGPPTAACPPLDSNRFQHAGPERNWVALIAFGLGVLSLIPLGGCVAGPRVWNSIYPASRPLGTLWSTMILVGTLELVLGPAALLFGILGVRYRNRPPTAGGLGYAIFGIVIGILTSLVGLTLVMSADAVVGVAAAVSGH